MNANFILNHIATREYRDGIGALVMRGMKSVEESSKIIGKTEK